MVSEIEFSDLTITKRVRAIVSFGMPTPQSGFRAGEFYQVTIDPNMKSPGGDFIRFDMTYQGGEVHGWQRVQAMTVWEVLGEAEDYKETPAGYVVEEGASVVLRAVSGAQMA